MRLLLANVWSLEKEMDKMGQNNLKSQTVVPTETCLYHNILDQAVALDGQTVFWANGAQDYSWTGRDGLWSGVHNISAWCSHSQSRWTVFTWCWTFDMKMSSTLSSASFCCCLHSPWHRFSLQIADMFCNLYSIKEFTNFHFVMQPCVV